MGRGRSGRGSVRGKGKGEAGEKSQYITRVDLYKFLCKWELRSYPDNQGRPLFDPASRLTTEHLRKILDGDCSELLRRPLMGLNLSSASLDSAALFAPKLASSLPQIQAMLEKESLNEAVRYFNLNRDVERDSSASQEMCKVYFKQIQKAARDQGTVIAEAAEAAAAVYTGLVALLELAAISEDIRWWASKVPEVKKQTKHVQAWLAHPKEEDRLFKALAHGIKADEKKNMRRERTFGQLDAEAAGSSSSTPLSVNDSDSISTDSSSALSGKKKKKKNARAHKKSNEAKHKKHRKTEKKAKGRDASDPKAKRARRHTKKTSSSSDSPSRSVRQKQRKVERGSDSTSAEAVPAAVAVLPPFREIWPLAEIQAFETKAQELATAAASTLVLERAGLRSTAEDDVLQANAERVSKHITEMVREARLAWIQEYVAASDALLKAQKAQSRILELAEHGLTQLDRVIKREAAEEQAKSAVADVAALREQQLRVGQRAEHFYSCFLQRVYGDAFKPSKDWVSSARLAIYPDARQGVDDAAGFDFLVVDTAQRIVPSRGKRSTRCFIEVKGSAGTFPGMFCLSANEQRKRDEVTASKGEGNAYVIAVVDNVENLEHASLRHFIWSDDAAMLRLEADSYIARVDPARGTPVSTGPAAAPSDERSRAAPLAPKAKAWEAKAAPKPKAARKLSVSIPSASVPAVIGKGGSTIRWLQEESGARIQVGETTPAGMASVSLEGTTQQIDVAKEMLQVAYGRGSSERSGRSWRSAAWQ
ncbi:unnamed protein product [Symbiodinium natans]|uniref:K Homology domain-containing protein n=1 Tax=Symbiodinium natans TaxID=878477 RepID=A0A812LYL1_9DINO|nr:unnamed protein product [Symbiodinium natans]